MSSKKLSNILMLIGVTIAIVLGSVHMFIGFPRLSTALSEGGTLPAIWNQLFKAIWVIFGVHLFFIAALILYHVFWNHALPPIIVVLCGVTSFLDGVFLASYAPLMNLGFGAPGLFFILGGILAASPALRQERYTA